MCAPLCPTETEQSRLELPGGEEELCASARGVLSQRRQGRGPAWPPLLLRTEPSPLVGSMGTGTHPPVARAWVRACAAGLPVLLAPAGMPGLHSQQAAAAAPVNRGAASLASGCHAQFHLPGGSRSHQFKAFGIRCQGETACAFGGFGWGGVGLWEPRWWFSKLPLGLLRAVSLLRMLELLRCLKR